jgi:hypothetical protein
VEMVGLADAFDGGDLVHRVHDGEGEAGVHAAAVDVYRAGAALAVVATFLCARHVQIFPEAIEQRGARVEFQVVLFAVDAKRERDGAFNPVNRRHLFDGRRGMRRSRGEDGSSRCNTGGSKVREERPSTDATEKWLASVRCQFFLFLGNLSDFGLYWIFSHGKPQSGIKGRGDLENRCQTNCLQSEA